MFAVAVPLLEHAVEHESYKLFKSVKRVYAACRFSWLMTISSPFPPQ